MIVLAAFGGFVIGLAATPYQGVSRWNDLTHALIGAAMVAYAFTYS